MNTIIHDLRYGIRLLAKNPGFALIIVLSIAVGVSANTAVFCWIESIVRNPLPSVPRSEEIVTLATRTKSGEYITSSYADYQDIREQNKSLAGLAAFQERPLGYENHGETERVWAMLVTGNFFDVLGIQPARGRFFEAQQKVDTTGTYPVAVVSYDFWKSRLDADPAAIGKTIRLNHQGLTVVGVAPEGFRGTIMGLSFDVWVPLQMTDKLTGGGTGWITIRRWRALHSIGRLKAGVGLAEAQAELNLLSSRLAQLYPADNAGITAALFPPSKAPYGAQAMLATLLDVLFLASFVVLLIVCSNLANLLLVRAAEREKEIAIRIAMGASRGRVFCQLTTESLVLSLAAAALSIVLAFRMSELLRFFIPATNIPVSFALALDPKVLWFAVLLSIAAGLASGLLPAVRGTSVQVNAALTDASRGSSAGRGKRRLRSVLAISEVALALVALTSAGLFLKSFRNIARINSGFDDEHVLLVGLMPAAPGHTVAEMTQFYRRLEERLQTFPEVRQVSFAEHVPLGLQEGSWEDIEVEGYTPRAEEDMNIYRNLVDGHYFDAMRIPLLEGRDFRLQDNDSAPAVAIVNQTFAARFFAGGSAVGRRLRGWGKTLTVVGVAKDSKYSNPTESPRPYLYVPFRQFAGPDTDVALHVATQGAPGKIASAVQREIASLNSLAYVSYQMPLREYIGAAVFKNKMAAALMSVLGCTALLLAALGIYGVISHSVTQRRAEIGIRMALGASDTGILKLVVFQGLKITLVGLAVGLFAASSVAGLLSTLLYGVNPLDLVTLLGASFLLLVISLVASGIPAYRASRMDPLKALR